jgi:hypothetical protein
MPLIHSIATALAGHLETIRDINRRYATPRIRMSAMVRLALLTLRIYLLVLVALLVYKFLTLLH